MGKKILSSIIVEAEKVRPRLNKGWDLLMSAYLHNCHHLVFRALKGLRKCLRNWFSFWSTKTIGKTHHWSWLQEGYSLTGSGLNAPTQQEWIILCPAPQVKHMNFYDIVLDFILMDSFEDLENPPTSIQNVISNRWLNNSFKETVCFLFWQTTSPVQLYLNLLSFKVRT